MLLGPESDCQACERRLGGLRIEESVLGEAGASRSGSGLTVNTDEQVSRAADLKTEIRALALGLVLAGLLEQALGAGGVVDAAGTESCQRRDGLI